MPNLAKLNANHPSSRSVHDAQPRLSYWNLEILGLPSASASYHATLEVRDWAVQPRKFETCPRRGATSCNQQLTRQSGSFCTVFVPMLSTRAAQLIVSVYKCALSMDSKFGFISLQPQCMDQRRKRSWLLSAARVIEEKAGERLAPVLQHAHERPFRQMLGREFLRHEGKSESF